jgi:DNA-binding transcriptional regulator LsrR (DeoR family)
MNPAFRSLMWYLLVGTRGGPNRRRILEELHRSPSNAHQLATVVGLDYRTVRHHLRLLEQNGVVSRSVPNAYAPPYELSPYLAEHFDLVQTTVVAAPAPRSRRLSARTPGSLARGSEGGL